MLKPKLLKVEQAKELSFGIRHEKAAHFDNPWHYHPEFELTLVTSSSGIRFVGDCVEKFGGDDLVLLGSNLPHYWRNHEDFYREDCAEYAEAYILRFKDNLVSRMIFELPETTKINQLFKKAAQGIWFGKAVARNIQPLFEKILASEGTERIIGFLEVMHQLSITEDYKILSTKSFAGLNFQSSPDRINKVLNYINKNLQEVIPLQIIADQANMNPTAFCRYIKAQTGKTFVELLNDIRIANACRLLLDTNQNITEISYECGYSTVTHFNYIFKQVTGENPSNYRKKWSDK